jgi:cytochrome c
VLLVTVVGAALSQAYAQTALPPGDPVAGAVVFQKCMSCHEVGLNTGMGVGPSLYGVVGSAAATDPGYRYSASLKNAGLVWNVATLSDFLRGPSAQVPGTKMTFPGLVRNEDIADVIAYLQTTDPQCE